MLNTRLGVSPHPSQCVRSGESPAALPQDSFLCSWIRPLHCAVLLPEAHTAAGPDTAGPIRACLLVSMFPALLQIMHAWTLSSSLTNSVLHHFPKLSFLRGNLAHQSSMSALVFTEVKTPLR